MAAVAHNPAFAKKAGVPQSVGQDFNEADKGRKFGKGGNTMMTRKPNSAAMAQMAAKKPNPAAMAQMAAQLAPPSPPPAPAKIPTAVRSRPDLQQVNDPNTNQGKNELFKKGGSTMAKFEKSGKDVEPKGMREGSKKEEAFDKKQMMGMKKGGGVKKMAEGGMADLAQDKALIKKAFREHDAQEHKGGKGTKLKLASGGAFRSAANGIAQRGKTRGKMC